jgi:hypothetical protein
MFNRNATGVRAAGLGGISQLSVGGEVLRRSARTSLALRLNILPRYLDSATLRSVIRRKFLPHNS